ncbi:hypothetical protein [Herbidospora mongoliensis]|uniref:hypothetical protein n=1 Tax=Herbidospora mongoliensis TaxID=688067 RepID=UPI0012F8D61B|nr:hypothetical protein [Herbidospora mongoliensis]
MGENRGIDGESEVVAERSGADTETPEHPISRDPEPLTDPKSDDDLGEDSEMPEPEPEVGPAS